jgi:hypothetical protein
MQPDRVADGGVVAEAARKRAAEGRHIGMGADK